MERKVLGRGLEALIPQGAQSANLERVQMIKLTQIKPSRFQPRLTFLPEKINELAQSIKEKGVIQPVILRSVDGGENFELIAGERRFRAVQKLGHTEIPAIVRRVPDADILEMSLIENIQREELNAIEEAKAYKRLAQEFGLAQDTIAERVGKDKSSISNLLRLLVLPQIIQDYLSKDMISFGHAKALLAFGDEKKQIKFCEKIIKNGLSVRQAEAATLKKVRGRGILPGPTKDTDLKSLEEKLMHALGTKVRIYHGKKRGRIEIDYYSLEDLDRILTRLTAGSDPTSKVRN